uniref:Uncharacterized protein n=1 Tax=Aegilops tauschii subsp. strangulata TaxID=200361 RepID=A0A453SSL4_AEGTS
MEANAFVSSTGTSVLKRDAYLRVTSIPVISYQGTGYLHRIPWANPYLRHEINDLEKGILSRSVQHTRCSLPVTSIGEVVIVSCIPTTKTVYPGEGGRQDQSRCGRPVTTRGNDRVPYLLLASSYPVMGTARWEPGQCFVLKEPFLQVVAKRYCWSSQQMD